MNSVTGARRTAYAANQHSVSIIGSDIGLSLCLATLTKHRIGKIVVPQALRRTRSVHVEKTLDQIGHWPIDMRSAAKKPTSVDLYYCLLK